jgi:hypothetical protein
LELVVRGSRGAPGFSHSGDDSAGGIAEARGLLKQSGLDEETSQRIEGILTSYRAGRKSDTLEFRVVCEAAQMADFQADRG